MAPVHLVPPYLTSLHRSNTSRTRIYVLSISRSRYSSDGSHNGATQIVRLHYLQRLRKPQCKESRNILEKLQRHDVRKLKIILRAQEAIQPTLGLLGSALKAHPAHLISGRMKVSKKISAISTIIGVPFALSLES